MLYVDYKIGTKALAARLQKVLSSVLPEDQTCYIPWLRRCWGQPQEYQGVRLPGSSEESKISQYADDGNLTLVDKYSITKAFEIEKGSGSKLNLDKTKGMWFGSMAGRTDGPVNIKWRTDFIKVLGIFLEDRFC